MTTSEQITPVPGARDEPPEASHFDVSQWSFPTMCDRAKALRNAGNEVSMRNSFQSDVSQLPFVWTRGIAARETLRYLDRKGIDADQLLSTTELSRAQLTENPSDVSAVSQHRFLELAAVETDDPLLGLHVAAEMDLREIGLLFYLAASSATVAEALERLAEYAATTTEEIPLRSCPRKARPCCISTACSPLTSLYASNPN